LRDRAGVGGIDLFAKRHEMKSWNIGSLVLYCLLIPGFAGVWKLQEKIDAQFDGMHREADDLTLRSGKLLKAMSLEYAPLMADLYWTRVVQYYGDKAVRHDPNLLVAYRFGSMFLSENAPRGAGRPDLAIQLVERGIQANPEYWRFYEDLGFIYYFQLHDYDKAGMVFLEGSKKPGALPWMKVLAAKVSEQGDNPETSAFLWNEIYTSSSDPQMKDNAATHLQLLKSDEDCKAIDALSDEFEKKSGRRASSIQELVDAGLLKGVPTDPTGRAYVLDSDGKAQLDQESLLGKKKRFYSKTLSNLANPNK
jgi:tetratricopeptide (TPR) repeat protein